MMHIVVDDQYALQLVCIECVLCRQRHVVKVTISIEFGLHCMMTWWPDDGHAILRLPPQQLIHQVDG